MPIPSIRQAQLAYPSRSDQKKGPQTRPKQVFEDEPPRKPDWLLILVGMLFLLTFLIAWLTH